MPVNIARFSRSRFPRIKLPIFSSICIIIACLCAPTFAQRDLPYLQSGPDSAFAQADFSQIYVAEQLFDANGEPDIPRPGGASSDVVSFLDLAAPRQAVGKFEQGLSLLKAQKTKDAIRFLAKAIDIYPEFVSAHNALGFAYLDQHDPRSKAEFETASQLDPSFPASFFNLGIVALRSGDFAGADSNLEKAAVLNPGDQRYLSALAFAQNGDHKYAECLRTVEKIHARKHHGLATVHYVAAAAAQSLLDTATVRAQLRTFLAEDPSNPLSPAASKYLASIKDANPRAALPPQPTAQGELSIELAPLPLASSDRLKAQLSFTKDDPDSDECGGCAEDTPPSPAATVHNANFSSTYETWGDLFTIHRAVDEAALFLSVSHHGRLVNDLSASDIKIRDDNKPPEKILQFVPQSKLPLRLGLLIDASDSIGRRASFELQAAKNFIRKVLNGSSDLAFVAGFTTEVTVPQDFTNDPSKLEAGIDRLNFGGDGTSVFDAVYYATWKLAALPEQDRVARVLVLITDGEDNSSHSSLQQSIERAEASGVTVYALSTSEKVAVRTDADRVLQVLAERSGGQAMFPGTLPAFNKDVERLADVIRSRYLIAYRPSDFVPDGRYRAIQVRAAKDGRRLDVHVRKGYYARLSSNVN